MLNETPIQKIVRENNERIQENNSPKNIQIMAKRLHNLLDIKKKLGLREQDNTIAYSRNKAEKTKAKHRSLKPLTELIRNAQLSMRAV